MLRAVSGFSKLPWWALAFGLAVFGLAACQGESTLEHENDESAGRGGVSAGGSASGGAAAGDVGSGGVSKGGGSGAGTGGSAGLGGSGIGGLAGASGAGAGGSVSGTGGLPEAPWVPRGVFGDAVDTFVAARTDYTQAICCAAFCCNDPTRLDDAKGCVAAEYGNFVPTAGWLACASRLATTDPAVSAWLGSQAGCYEACAVPSRRQACPSLEITPCTCESEPDALAACQSRSYELYCPTDSGESLLFRACNGNAECPDGFDEANCDPTAPRFRCASGELVPWLSLCDGVAACSDGTDENGCQRSAAE